MKIKILYNAEKRIARFIGASILIIFIINARYFISKALLDAVKPEIIYNLATIVYLTLFIITIPSIVRKTKTKTILIFTFMAILATLNYILFPETKEYFTDTLKTFCALCFPSMIAVLSISDYAVLKKYLYVFSRITCITCITLMIILWRKATVEIVNESYQMGLGYAALLPILLMIWKINEDKKSIDIILAIGSIVFIILRASRGPLVAIITFVLYMIIKKMIIQKNIAKSIITIVASLVFLLNFGNIARIITSYAEKAGVSSRTVTLLSTDIYHDSGRQKLYNKIITEINEEPFKIRGINSDYITLGIYTHNILLELLYEFGVIIGGILIIILLVISIKIIIKANKDNPADMLCVILTISAFACLMVSNSLWIKYDFWVWVALIINSGMLINKKINPHISEKLLGEQKK